MDNLTIDLENCYGIRNLQQTFDFAREKAYAIYAPNGAMKSSLANTFADVASGKDSADRIFTARVTKRDIHWRDGSALASADVLVVRPYDEVFSHSERTSTLLVNAALREEYEALHVEVENAKNGLIQALKAQSGSKKDLAREISLTFTRSESDFYRALVRISEELKEQKEAPFADVVYDIIFDDKVIEMLGTKDVKTTLEEYITKYNELIAASSYFKRGIFSYYNASQIAKNLAENGFFKANHTINLNADARLEITDEKQLEELIKKEKEGISNDPALRKSFGNIEKLLAKNVNLRNFEQYLGEHEEILPQLANLELFREEIWKSYIVKHYDIYESMVEKYKAAEKRRKEIEDQAEVERTQWESVIEIFNSRFFVPFRLEAKNRTSVILGQEPMLMLGFVFEEGLERASIDRTALLSVLSTGEKKALYILNIIFEIQTRTQAGQPTLLVVDDIADSFDYKNKYAIIQYLKDVTEDTNFKQIILTHNFDFFRTLESRYIPYRNCLMATKSATGIELGKAAGIRNVFVKDWKVNFSVDAKKRIACIPFMRNLIEFTKGEDDVDYIALTSLLHYKADSDAVTQAMLADIYNRLFGANLTANDPAGFVLDEIEREAGICLGAQEGVNFENKIVLAMATRLKSEKYMVGLLNDPAFVASIAANQTTALLREVKRRNASNPASIGVLDRVILMTPENIHLNSFMYEPILDMSDDHLRRLYQETAAL